VNAVARPASGRIGRFGRPERHSLRPSPGGDPGPGGVGSAVVPRSFFLVAAPTATGRQMSALGDRMARGGAPTR